MIKIILLLLLISSCSSNLLVKNRIEFADKLALSANLKKSVTQTSTFFLTNYSKIENPQSQHLSVYIEGDGYSWKNKYTISNNPTPTDPIALKMAIIDPSPNILYIARPCQYTDLELDKNCSNQYWSGSRFSKTVINSVNEVINKFTAKYKIKTINLYGFSGGGAVAVLLAAQRNDVNYIATIAANLDHEKLTKIHHTTPMNDSLNPIDYTEKIKNIKQLHIAGGADNIVPDYVIKSFVDKINLSGGKAEFKSIKNADHEFKNWPEIWSKNINNFNENN
jgi:predicted esterase